MGFGVHGFRVASLGIGVLGLKLGVGVQGLRGGLCAKDVSEWENARPIESTWVFVKTGRYQQTLHFLQLCSVGVPTVGGP